MFAIVTVKFYRCAVYKNVPIAAVFIWIVRGSGSETLVGIRIRTGLLKLVKSLLKMS